MDDQDTIDLRKVWQLMLEHKKRLLKIVFFTTLAALIIAFLLPKQYESTVLIRAKAQQQNSFSLQASAALALLGGSGVQSPTQIYMEMLKSRSVLEPVIAELDLPAEDKEKLDNKKFAKKYLEITNAKGTDLIELAATGRTPEEAQKIAADVMAAFKNTLTRVNQTEQSAMMKFLQERMTIAQQEMEQSEQSLEKFRQQEKIYVPDEQAKAIIEKLAGYDQEIAKVQVQLEADQVKLREVNAQLSKQNAALTSYNIADNEAVQEIRSNIIQKQMKLIELEQRYMEKHPSVIIARKEIDELTAQLRNEVNAAVQSGTATLNPIHAGLLLEKVQTETAITVGQAMLNGLQTIQQQSDQEISKLSVSGLTYIGLERQTRITREVYTLLVKNYEQARLQQAMESMDIQVIDEPNLPVKPSGPRKLLITVVGGILGIMLSFGYLVVLYSRNELRESHAVEL